jgi:putative aldouronate transport system substrate-binding protein
MGPIYQSSVWRNSYQSAPPANTAAGYGTFLHQVTMRLYIGHQPKFVFPAAVWIPASDAQQYSMLQTNINTFVTEWTAQFITGSKDITNDWATYVQGVKSLGLSQYLQMAQTAMGKPLDTSEYKASGS